jgi:hypothetical protein
MRLNTSGAPEKRKEPMTSKILRKPSGMSGEKLKGAERCAEMLPDLQEFLLIGLDQSNNLIVQSTLGMSDTFKLCDMMRDAMIESLQVSENNRMN